MMAEAALDQKLGTLLRMHEEAFRQLGGVTEEILYDRMKTVWLDTDERGEIVWNPVFLDFARYWGFTPRLCRPYRAQTKGKVESGVKYVRRNFLCGLQGRAAQLGRDERGPARLDVGSGEPAGARHDPLFGERTLGSGEAGAAAAGGTRAVSVFRRRVAAGVARCLRCLAGEPVLGAVALRRATGAGARIKRVGRGLCRPATHCGARARGGAAPDGGASGASRRHTSGRAAVAGEAAGAHSSAGSRGRSALAGRV